MARMGNLGEYLPALAQHLPDVGVHILHAEEPLPMVGSVPASLIGEGFNLHPNPAPSTYLETLPPVSVYAAALAVVPGAP